MRPNGQRLDLVGTIDPGTQNPQLGGGRKIASLTPRTHQPRAMQGLPSLCLSVNDHHSQLD